MVEFLEKAWRAGRGSAVAFSVLVLLPVSGAATNADPPEPLHPTVVPAGPLRARLQLWRRSDAGVQVVDSLLAARIDNLRRTAPSFALAWDELERSGVPVVIGSGTQLGEILPADVRTSSAWAGITVSWGGGSGRLDRAAVAIRVEWLEQLHDRYRTPPGAFEEALDGLLIHEVYGHLAPVVRARDARKQCPDPRGRQRLADSCVGKRELAVKAERKTLLASLPG